MLRIGMPPSPSPSTPTAPGPGDPGAGPDPSALLAALAGGGDPSSAGPDQGQDSSPKGKKFSIDMVDPKIAGYMGPESGPFECEHCVHFSAPAACHVVSGKIDPHGCCNLYNQGQAEGGDDESQEDPEEEATETPDDEAAEPQPGPQGA